MLGRLSLDSIPLHDPVIVVTLIGIVLGGIALVSAITYFGKWQYLWTEWFTSVDHKKIGFMYIAVALIMLFRGFADAVMMRTQQLLSSAGGEGFLPPHHYDQIFTAHGVIMIFFVAMPLVIGLMNIVVPLQIGARDVAYPYLNNLSFWLFIVGVILMNISLGIGEFAQAGWLLYPVGLLQNDSVSGVGVDYWIWALQISGVGTTLSGVNFFATILKMRSPSMPLMKMPVFTWASLCSNILIIISFPILTVTIALLTLDRYLGTHFFTNDMGGNMMMYVNLIWAWGHPEVYILVLPVFGIYSEVVATFARKKLFGYTSLVWATGVITILAFIVWLHHFFTMGGGANVNAFFGVATMIISIPTGVKIFNWLFTMYGGRVHFTTPILWTIGFLITFTIGGLTGVLLAVPGVNFVTHGTVFVIAHFHNVIIGGVVFGCFTGLTYWFPKMTGFKLHEGWGKAAFGFWVIGFLVAFMPIYAAGFAGMPRRISQDIDPEFFPYLATAAFGTFLIFCGVACQGIQIAYSIWKRKDLMDVSGDPWDARTLEWATSSPPPFYNFAHLPKGDELDAFWYQKQRGEAGVEATLNAEPEYKPIHMPKNTAMGMVVSAFSLIFGFAMIWHIWWMAGIGFIGIVVSSIMHSFNYERDYYVSAEEVKAIEDAHKEKLRQAYKNTAQEKTPLSDTEAEANNAN